MCNRQDKPQKDTNKRITINNKTQEKGMICFADRYNSLNTWLLSCKSSSIQGGGGGLGFSGAIEQNVYVILACCAIIACGFSGCQCHNLPYHQNHRCSHTSCPRSVDP